MLAREEVPGLAVRLPSGEWLAPPVIPGTLLVNLGNMMKRWSNDRFLSTPHGVLNDSGTDRYSIAFFYSPNPASVDRVPAELHGPRQSAALSAGGLPRPHPRVLQRELLPPRGIRQGVLKDVKAMGAGEARRRSCRAPHGLAGRVEKSYTASLANLDLG